MKCVQVELIVPIELLLSVTCYLGLSICYLLYDAFYMKLAITCKNLFLSLIVVRLVIFTKVTIISASHYA